MVRGDKAARSHRYQHIFEEIFFDETMLITFDNSQGIPGNLNPFIYNENIFSIKEKIYKFVWNTINNNCTEIQKKILSFIYKDQLTHAEASKILNVNISIISHSLFGTKKNKCGSIKKIKRILEQDKEFQNLLKELNDEQEIRY